MSLNHHSLLLTAYPDQLGDGFGKGKCSCHKGATRTLDLHQRMEDRVSKKLPRSFLFDLPMSKLNLDDFRLEGDDKEVVMPRPSSTVTKTVPKLTV